MDLHIIKNVKSPVNELDAVNTAYVDRIKCKAAIGIIPDTVMTDHTRFTFPAVKAFASERIIIYVMWVERLADEWIATQVQCSQLRGLDYTSFREARPF